MSQPSSGSIPDSSHPRFRFFSAAWPYGLPFAAWVLFTVSESLFPSALPLLDPLRAGFVLTLCLGCICLRRWPAFGPWHGMGSLLAGFFIASLWLMTVTLFPPVAYQGGVPPFNPHRLISKPGFPSASFLLIGHALGTILSGPLSAEVFARGFLMRVLIRRDFESVPIGEFSPVSFIAATFILILLHPLGGFSAWILPLLFGTWFLYTKSLGGVLVANIVFYAIQAADIISGFRWNLW